MTRVVFALDSFKGSLSATAATAALAQGWADIRPCDDVVLRPMADGGEGTLDAFAAAVVGCTRIPVTVRGPAGVDVEASWLLMPDGTGVVELASTSGIELLDDGLRPWTADTRGFGEAIAAALDRGVSRLILGIGSSASTDGGLGLLTALGARILDGGGLPVALGARGLSSVASVGLTSLRDLPPGGAVVLSDVTNPLTGPHGAAAVFGAQKGLDDDGISFADDALRRFADLVDGSNLEQHPGAGAAGGAGFGLLLWGAKLAPGSAAIADLIRLSDAIEAADLVITGEGSYDSQSAAGKVPAFVGKAAASFGIPAALVAGRIADDADMSGFAWSTSLSMLAGSSAASMASPAAWLRAAGAELAVCAP